ncbi:hypothetical protein P7_066 [Pectobacterium phage vB_PcaM_P7_Pc]|nr:hypothetical protein P7_066 [Pectobacterium phage vB_PcaM_P7_Pc]
MSEIKCCPFCGNPADYWQDDQYLDRHVIECSYCGAERRSEYGYEDVLSDWNRRFDGSGKLIPEAANKTHFVPTVLARRGYLEGTGEYDDVVVWKGSPEETMLSAIAVAEEKVQSVQLLGVVSTEGIDE